MHVILVNTTYSLTGNKYILAFCLWRRVLIRSEGLASALKRPLLRPLLQDKVSWCKSGKPLWLLTLQEKMEVAVVETQSVIHAKVQSRHLYDIVTWPMKAEYKVKNTDEGLR